MTHHNAIPCYLSVMLYYTILSISENQCNHYKYLVRNTKRPRFRTSIPNPKTHSITLGIYHIIAWDASDIMKTPEILSTISAKRTAVPLGWINTGNQKKDHFLGCSKSLPVSVVFQFSICWFCVSIKLFYLLLQSRRQGKTFDATENLLYLVLPQLKVRPYFRSV